MSILFIILVLLGGASWRYFQAFGAVRVGLSEIAFVLLYAYCLVLFSALSLIWFDHWSIFAHCSVVLLLSCVPSYFFLQRLFCKRFYFRWEIPWKESLGFLLLLGVGCAMQWKGVYQIFPTHDSGAYLNAAGYLHGQGRFFHHDPLWAEANKAKGNKEELNELAPFYAPSDLEHGLYGFYPANPGKGKRSFQGLFGASLFLALGIEFFGSKHAHKIYWVHLAVSLLLILATMQLFLGQFSPWSWVAGFLYLMCPLVAPIYREPLSEPLAQVFFLGMFFYVISQAKKALFPVGYPFLVCLLGATCARASGFMMVPFFVLAAAASQHRPPRRFWWVSAFSFMGVTATLCHLSPHYLSGLVNALLNPVRKIWVSMPQEMSAVVLLPILILLFITLLASNAHRVRRFAEWIRTPKIWLVVWVLYGLVLLGGLIFRYTKVFLYFGETIGGFPFVQFTLDSILFYVGPVLVIGGFYYWFKQAYRWSIGDHVFVQAYLPFCFFFYTVYYFSAFDTQVYIQRYFLPEIVPLATMGACLLFAQMSRVAQGATIARVLCLFSLLWSGVITYYINHFDMCRSTREAYEGLARAFTLRAEGERRPFVVNTDPEWRPSSFLMPLAGTYNYPIVFAKFPFSLEKQRAVEAAIQKGFEPVLTFKTEQAPQDSIRVGNQSWHRWKRFKHCYRYSIFRLPAPPTELAEVCADYSFFVPAIEKARR